MSVQIITSRHTVNRLSDFQVDMVLEKDGVLYMPASFVMAFYVGEWSCEDAYVASRLDGQTTNCEISGSVISVYFNSPGFPLGQLKCRVFDSVDNAAFTDGTLDTCTPLTLPIEIVATAGDSEVISLYTDGYQPPATGIPKGDLEQSVQDTLDSVANKVDKEQGKGLSTEDFTAALKAKLEALDPYTKAEVDDKVANAGKVKSVTINGTKKNPDQQTGDIDLGTIPTMQQMNSAISEMEATIEQQQLTVITGGKLSMWLDEDGESINIIAGDVPDIAATPVISSELVSNDPSSADNGKVRVTIATTEQGATIYYTTDGSTPTQQSSQYSSAIVLDTAGQHTIKAIAIVADKLLSSVATAQVTVSACSTPTISVNNTDRVNAVVTASAGSNESVSLTVGSQTATGTGSASVTIAKTSSPQSLSASASATAAGKLPASATQSVEVSAKEAYSFGAYEIGGKAADKDEPITITTKTGANASDFVTTNADVFEEEGEVYWKANLQNKIFSNVLQGKTSGTSTISIFEAGATNILTIEHIPEVVTKIGDAAFGGATNITTFKAGSNSHLIEMGAALKGFTSLEYVQLPDTVTFLHNSFTNCSALKTVIAAGVTILKDGASGVFKGCAELDNLTIGELTKVGSNAFDGCAKLELDDIDFSQVTDFGNSAFAGCKMLTRFTLKEGITKVHYGCFNGCSNLTTVSIPSTLTTIEQNGFGSCTKLLSIDLPAGFTTFGYNAFGSSGVNSSNGTITIRKEAASTSEVPTRANSNEFLSTGAIYVHANSVEAYKAAWSNLAAKIQAIPTT